MLAADHEPGQLLAELDTTSDADRLGQIHARLIDIGGYFSEAQAGVLFAQPDLLLLDEPKDYLNLEGAIWLESFIAKYRHTVLMNLHDLTLLNCSVKGILYFVGCGLLHYNVSYDQFENERRMKLE